MATYIILSNFTDQGVRASKNTTKRAEAFKAMAQKAGVTIKEFFYTMGLYDVVTIVEAPDDETASAVALSVGALGNIRSQTLRAFSLEEMGKIVSKMV